MITVKKSRMPMEKLYYDFNDFFESMARLKKVIYGTEAEIYFKDTQVYKIFNSSFSTRNEGTIEEIGKLDPKYLTIPTFLIYLGNIFKYEYYGFIMDNAGNNLKDILLNEDLTFDKRLDILNQIKEALLYLDDKGLHHGDINLGNILYDGEYARLGDVNNIIMPGSTVHANYFERMWYDAFLSYRIADYLAFNLLTYLLLNFSIEEIRDILKWEKNDPRSFRYMIISKPNKVFDNDIWENGVKELIYSKRLAKNGKEDILLIDYLK